MHPLSGIFTALLTPFDADERIDHDASGHLVDFQVRQGAQGLYVDGSSGEAMLQTQAERAAYLHTVAAANAGRLHLIAHVGTVATRRPHSTLAGRTPDEAYGVGRTERLAA